MLQTRVLRVSLLAFALQGMTPDAHDLASPTLWRVVQTALAGPSGAPGHEDSPVDLPARDRADDQLADEVCTPATRLGSASVRDPWKARTWTGGLVAVFVNAPGRAGPVGCSGRCPLQSRRARSFPSLCRLTC